MNFQVLVDNCFILKEKSYLTGGIESTTYKVQTIFVSNSEILDSDFNSIQKVSFSFKDFESWHSSSPITFQKEDGKGNKKTGFLYSYSDLQQKCQTIFLDYSKLKLSEQIKITSSFSKNFSNNALIQNKSLMFKYYDSSSINFRLVNKTVDYFHKIYSFFMNCSLALKKLTLFTGPLTADEELQEIQVFYCQRFAFSNRRYLLNHEDIKDSLPTILKSFDNNFAKLEKIIKGHLAKSFKDFFESTDFLQAARNLEMFHRNFFESEPELPENYESKKEELLNTLYESNSEELIEYFEDKINHKDNEVPLNKKLKELIGEIPVELKQELFNPSGGGVSNPINKFSKKITDTRNYYTHGTDISNYKAVIGNWEELYLTYIKMRCLTDILILKKLKVDKKIIINSIENKRGPYQRLFEHNNYLSIE